MRQAHRWGMANAAWGLAWSTMLAGTLLDDLRVLAWGIFFAAGGVVTMVWVIADHIQRAVESRLVEDLGERDRRRTIEMAEALVRADRDGIRLVD